MKRLERVGLFLMALGVFAMGVSMRLTDLGIVVILVLSYAACSGFIMLLLWALDDVTTERNGYRDAFRAAEKQLDRSLRLVSPEAD